MNVSSTINHARKTVVTIGIGLASAEMTPKPQMAAREYARTIPKDSWLRTPTGRRVFGVAKSQISWTSAKGTERFLLRRVREFLNYLFVELSK